MFRLSSALSAALVLAPCASTAFALEGLGEKDTPPIRLDLDDLTLVLEMEAELELHDLQGRGGPGHDSTTDRRTLGTRSPTAEIDSMWIALGVWPADAVRSHALLEFDADGARVAGFWIDVAAVAPPWLTHHIQLGLHPPIVYRNRRTERYPLAGTIYWRESELHVVYEQQARLGSRADLGFAASAAFMRPLGFSSVHDSKEQQGTINVLAYRSARAFSGNAAVGGALLRATFSGAFVEAFGFIGGLAAEAGTDALRTTLTRFRDLPGYNDTDPEDQDRTFRWFGGRTGYEEHGVHLWGEAIGSRESLLRRIAGYAQVSYEVQLRPADKPFHRIEPLIRYEWMRIVDAARVRSSGRALRSPAPSEAPTWDFDVLTGAVALSILREMIRTRVEYSWIREENGVPALDIPNTQLHNNELIVQLEVGL